MEHQFPGLSPFPWLSRRQWGSGLRSRSGLPHGTALDARHPPYPDCFQDENRPPSKGIAVGAKLLHLAACEACSSHLSSLALLRPDKWQPGYQLRSHQINTLAMALSGDQVDFSTGRRMVTRSKCAGNPARRAKKIAESETRSPRKAVANFGSCSVTSSSEPASSSLAPQSFPAFSRQSGSTHLLR